MQAFFDLSQSIENGMSFFPDDPEPRVEAAPQSLPPWQVSRLMLGSHTGTHIDAACHYIPGGASIDRYPLTRFVLQGIVIPFHDLGKDQAIEAARLNQFAAKIPKGGAVLIQTGWDRYWNSKEYNQHPYLSREAAQILKNTGASLVGIDALNVDSTKQGTSHVHEILLGGDVLIVENLKGLSQLKALWRYQFSFLPLPVKGSDGSPVRAVAWEDQ